MSLLSSIANGNGQRNSSWNVVAPYIFSWGNGHHSKQWVTVIFLQMIECMFWMYTKYSTHANNLMDQEPFFCSLTVRGTIPIVPLPFDPKILFYAMFFFNDSSKCLSLIAYLWLMLVCEELTPSDVHWWHIVENLLWLLHNQTFQVLVHAGNARDREREWAEGVLMLQVVLHLMQLYQH